MQHYNSDSIYGLTLTWVTSENSTKQLECQIILTRSSSPSLDPISCWLASLPRCPVSTALVRVPLPTPNFALLFPTLFSRPVTTSGYGEISGPRTPLSGFAPKQTKESSAWLATHIVLHKYLDPTKKLKRTVEHENDGYTNCNWCSWYSHQRISKKTRGNGNKRTSGDNPNYSIVEIGQNTEKSPGDLRRLVVTETPMLTLIWKTLKE